jgi:DNA-directed RNA polymerase sigma subunit (sigma70/sigma32)
MRCEKCGQRKATYHITTVLHAANRVRAKTIDLCPACARAGGFDQEVQASLVQLAAKAGSGGAPPDAPPAFPPRFDPVRHYLRQLARIPPLPGGEERELFRRARSRRRPDDAQKARTRIVEAHLKLVIAIAKKHLKHGLSLLDLIQAGNLGLLRAMKSFGSARKERFADYARPRIERAVTQALIRLRSRSKPRRAGL